MYVECTNFPKNFEPSQNSRLQMGDMKHVSCCGLTDIMRHRTTFSRLGFLASKICVRQVYTTATDQEHCPKLVFLSYISPLNYREDKRCEVYDVTYTYT